ncbi:GDSL-type esterase/lipase family protein [Mucilaginibacter aquatilis]|uniref:Lipolytic protein G-D-S-L family n=1 Tax=Mucilaginibacter aquatilis TaxID=1517760 RepID=A0A6I4IGD9_9SPHI|nr:GDSL-type esterase/lipase family protein [Mucilaginibacter aquatilis]MVN92698.1 lipolytic protein G-D-S-L family [Mucilaginibacter aquatilis]
MKFNKLPYYLLLVFIACSAFIYNDNQKVNVVFIGDSITHGTVAKDQSPPVFTGHLLREKLGPNVQVSNQGVSGFTTVDFLPATKKMFPKVKAAANNFYADSTAQLVFSIMLGTNDSAIKGPNGSPVSPENYQANLKTIADSLLAAYPKAKIVFNYPLWYSDNTHNRSSYLKEGQQRVLSYHPQIHALVKQYKKSNPHHVFEGDRKSFKYFEKNYLTYLKPENGTQGTFYLHPNTQGEQVLAKLWSTAILKALKN